MKRIILALISGAIIISGLSGQSSNVQLELECFSGLVEKKDCGNCGSFNATRFWAKGVKIRNKSQRKDYYVLDPVVGYARGNQIRLVGGLDNNGNPTGFSFNRSQLGISFDSLDTKLQECQCCSLVSGGGPGGGDIIQNVTYNGQVFTITTDLGTFNASVHAGVIQTFNSVTIGPTSYPAGTDVETILNAIQSAVMQVDWWVSNDTAYFRDVEGNVYSHYIGPSSGGATEAESGTYVNNGRVRLSGEGANFHPLLEPKYIGGDDVKITFGDNEGAFTNRLIFDNSTHAVEPNFRLNVGGASSNRSAFYYGPNVVQHTAVGNPGEESQFNWTGSQINFSQSLGGLTSNYFQKRDTIALVSGVFDPLSKIPAVGDPNHFFQVNNFTRIGFLSGGQIMTPRLLAGTATPGQALILQPDNSLDYEDVAKESHCIDTIQQTAHGFTHGDAVRMLGLNTWMTNPADSVQHGIVIDSLNDSTAVVFFCGEIDIASLSAGAQAYWNGLNNSLYYETNAGLSATPDAEARPAITRQAGSLFGPNYYSFGSGAGGSSDPFIFDSQGGTTDANGYVDIPHSLGVGPSSVVANVFDSNANTMYSAMVVVMTSANIRVRIWDNVANSALANTFVTVNYFIK